MVPLALLVVLLAADVPRVTRLVPPDPKSVTIPRGETIPVLPDLTPTTQAPEKASQDKPKAERLRPESRLAILRYVLGEFARAVKSLPGGKQGLRIVPGQAPGPDSSQQASSKPGVIVMGATRAANPGDMVQITGVEFRDREILLHVNGGGKKKIRWADHVQVSVGGGLPRATTTNSAQESTSDYRGGGSTLILDFGKPVPDLTPDEVKQIVAGYLDFSKQRSAAVQWIDTLPPEFAKAIKEKRAMVGMDKEMVRAAIGQPERKIREKDADGLETEDWIYGRPPSHIVFVKFAGDKVISVAEYPR